MNRTTHRSLSSLAALSPGDSVRVGVLALTARVQAVKLASDSWRAAGVATIACVQYVDTDRSIYIGETATGEFFHLYQEDGIDFFGFILPVFPV